MFSIKPKDVIALVVIIGIFIMKLKGVDGELDNVAALILGYYFVKRQNGIDNGK